MCAEGREDTAVIMVPPGGVKTGRDAIKAAEGGLVVYEEPAYPAATAAAAETVVFAAAAAAANGGGGDQGSESSSHATKPSTTSWKSDSRLGVLGTSPWMLPYAWGPTLKHHEWESMCRVPGVLEQALAVGAGRIRGALKAVRGTEGFTGKLLSQVDEGFKAPASAQVRWDLDRKLATCDK
jgi:hypothetical protein